ncbi:uncharacterized protein ygiD [Geofilum rubicundum JCM 15548]|uniref:Uncharacterized protein ygiD n=2 Tax=Geofilum TaxID=1236988 RepID=A0A0E9M1Y7_9BACT|nr:uncharacterized protein ygiD [Geofilum rubicundum JCM 15548]
MSLTTLNKIADGFPSTPKMPLLFLGHGSPMNAIEENEFVQGFRKVAEGLPTPKAILCISAHWETRGTFVTGMEQPRTIHDFGGFPKALFEVQYSAPGSPALAHLTQEVVHSAELGLDDAWGLDHGAWSVIKHLYPGADIPVVQMSLDYLQTPEYHYQLAGELRALREKGILIIGSGNMVHNLRLLEWGKMNSIYGYDWALEASEKMKNFILNDDHRRLINYRCHGKSFELAVPTPEHYLPLLYVMGLKTGNEAVSLFNDKTVAGSITMTSVKIG